MIAIVLFCEKLTDSRGFNDNLDKLFLQVARLPACSSRNSFKKKYKLKKVEPN